MYVLHQFNLLHIDAPLIECKQNELKEGYIG
ncbi:hypothetical protein GNP79_13425 [Aliivibrio fischeri]|uniref:Uncharacterized protein n=1 Tax=Aliivibrio fischeri TaxID=668 RepID=A0A6N3Z543_ALIFS|nr:hypothetical protein [Aliivibrio fischeri]MUK81796.1 hypothetical protein [Aliivibrio fischeri]MUK85149.1 hypothetical protein [Aliivibrio fischeri]